MSIEREQSIYLHMLCSVPSITISVSKQMSFYIGFYVHIYPYIYKLLFDLCGKLDCLENPGSSINCVKSLPIWKKISWISFWSQPPSYIEDDVKNQNFSGGNPDKEKQFATQITKDYCPHYRKNLCKHRIWRQFTVTEIQKVAPEHEKGHLVSHMIIEFRIKMVSRFCFFPIRSTKSRSLKTVLEMWGRTWRPWEPGSDMTTKYLALFSNRLRPHKQSDARNPGIPLVFSVSVGVKPMLNLVGIIEQVTMPTPMPQLCNHKVVFSINHHQPFINFIVADQAWLLHVPPALGTRVKTPHLCIQVSAFF